MSFTSSAFFSLFSGLLWLLLLLLLCVISHVSHALCISRYLMPLFTLFPLSPSLGRVLFSARVLQLYSIYSKSNGFFLPALSSFSSFSILFYFISTVCVFLSVCVCACVCAVIESHFNGRRFSRQFSLCCSWGQFWGQQLAQLAHWMFLLRQMNGNCPGLAVVVPGPLTLSPLLTLPFAIKLYHL